MNKCGCDCCISVCMRLYHVYTRITLPILFFATAAAAAAFSRHYECFICVFSSSSSSPIPCCFAGRCCWCWQLRCVVLLANVRNIVILGSNSWLTCLLARQKLLLCAAVSHLWNNTIPTSFCDDDATTSGGRGGGGGGVGAVAAASMLSILFSASAYHSYKFQRRSHPLLPPLSCAQFTWKRISTSPPFNPT